jgi:hypothetical protein
MNGRGAGPVFGGRADEALVTRCSMICAENRRWAKTKIGVNIAVGTPRK